MAVQLNIAYETLVELVDQLPQEQQQALLLHLLDKAKTRPLTKDEKKALFHASILSIPVNQEPSPRREDWYGDDGR